MVEKRKICVVTGTRAEYGLLYWLMKGIQASDRLELQLVVTGMHLSPEFGLTYQQIEQDGFVIDRKVEMLLSSDSEAGVGKSMGLAMIGFSEAFAELKPDMLLVLGDRFEIFSVAAVATVARIPIAHLHGGETTEGAFDEAFRHSITKMSHLHFVSTEVYRKRVIQLGEDPDCVFNVGAIGIDSINKLDLLSKDVLEQELGCKFKKRNLLITFHPTTLEYSTAKKQLAELLTALDDLEEAFFIFTKANADTGGRVINQMIDDYVEKNQARSIAFTSMGQLKYLSTMQYVDGVVGNSSSGLLEAPSFHVGTINIGDRQRGRVKPKSVIDCEPNSGSIRCALEILLSYPFRKKVRSVVNPYGNGNTSQRVLAELERVDLSCILKKTFVDNS